MRASVLFPKLVIQLGTPDTSFGTKGTTNPMILVPLFD